MDTSKIIEGKTLAEWQQLCPVLKPLAEGRETVWLNPRRQTGPGCSLTEQDILEATARLERFADYFRFAFPETAPQQGLIESPLRPVPAMQAALEQQYQTALPGELWLKLDSHLPISGSIKARGGIYEVLKTAEEIALKHGLLHPGDPYRLFDTPAFREVLSRYSIAVGSTGNLGLSIGIISARLGFRVTVHMSADAREWKKALLRSKGVTVVEYASDYSIAVAQGRQQALQDPYCHFVDDENSQTLFLGYAVAALRLKQQLEQAGKTVDARHPLCVYLPCGVGGGPGGVAFGLHTVFGDGVRCFFAEPTASCCMTLGLATGLHNAVCVQDIGLDNRTAADGLAVGRASGFVGRAVEPFLAGCYTLSDRRMYQMLAQLADSEQIFLEPSALAGMYGPVLAAQQKLGADACRGALHLVWATGGSMVPEKEMEQYYCRGKQAAEEDREG